jgi:DNA gyrase subunit A
MPKDHRVISLVVIQEKDANGTILTATANGYGKRTLLSEYSLINRVGQGRISIQVSERNGKVVGAVYVKDGDEVMLISNSGTLVRTHVDEVSVIGRNTQGVRLINLAGEEHLVAIDKIPIIVND